MQQPVGFVINNEAGRAEMVNFAALLTNETLFVAFPHTIFAGLSTAAFFILGISTYHLVRKQDEEFFKKSFRLGAIVGLIGAVMVGLTGHQQAQHMVETQPMKMAAAEKLWETEDPAGLSILTLGGEDPIVDFRIPGALSFLVHNRFTGEVEGIKQLEVELTQRYGPDNYVPPVELMYWSFRVMVFSGSAMVGLAALGLIFMRKKDFSFPKIWGSIFLLAISLPYLANSFGWIMTEVGRAPWTVYGILKLEDSISTNVTLGQLWMSLVGYIVLYGALMVADIYLLSKFAKAGLNSLEEKEEPETSPSFAPGLD
jgi:cytochrome d ubiquinol oxidase subunit I